jgi:hypothetical protein
MDATKNQIVPIINGKLHTRMKPQIKSACTRMLTMLAVIKIIPNQAKRSFFNPIRRNGAVKKKRCPSREIAMLTGSAAS